MFNHLRAKLVALAAFAASLVRGDEGSSGPVTTHHHLPNLKIQSFEPKRRGHLKWSAQVEMANGLEAGRKLAKRFAEAGHRSCRGY